MPAADLDLVVEVHDRARRAAAAVFDVGAVERDTAGGDVVLTQRSGGAEASCVGDAEQVERAERGAAVQADLADGSPGEG